MKKITTVLATLVIVFSALSGSAAIVEKHEYSTKTITLKAKSSKTLNITTVKNLKVVLWATADQGKVHIKVLNSIRKGHKTGLQRS